METPYVGTKFRVTGVFKIVATSAASPTSDVTVSVWNPAGTLNSYTTATTATDVTVTPSTAVGTYYVDVLPDDDGPWVIGAGSTGSVQAYGQITVRVLPRGI